VGFRGFAVAFGAAIALAIGAHGRQRHEPAPVRPTAKPVTRKAKATGNVVALVPKPKLGDVDAFLLEHVAPEEGARVSWADLFIRYRAWCEPKGCAPVAADAFGARLDALRTELGLLTRTKGKDVFFVGLKAS